MVSFTTVHCWNSLLCPPLGFLFNFLLLWLILRRTPKEMRFHSRILLQTCLLDNLLLAMQCIGQNAFTFDRRNSTFVFFFDSYYLVVQFNKALLNPLHLIIFHAGWLFLHNLSVFGIAVQFFYRYLVLNRNHKISLSQYLLLVFGTALCTLAMSTLLLLGLIATLNQHPIDRQRFGAFVDFEGNPLHYTIENQGNYLLLTGLVIYALLITITYITICCCGWKIVRFVSKNTTLTRRSKELNRQLTKCLIVLACVPLFISSASFALLYDIFFGRTTAMGFEWTLEWELYLVLTFHWIPVLNPLVTIYINRPYRDALIGKFIKISPAENEAPVMITRNLIV